MQDLNKNEVILPGSEFKKFDLDLKGNYFNAKLVFEKKLKGLSAIRFGAEYNYFNDKSVYTAYNGATISRQPKANIKAGFAESRYLYYKCLGCENRDKSGACICTLIKSILRHDFRWPTNSASGHRLQWHMVYFIKPLKSVYLPSAQALGFMKATHYIANIRKRATLAYFPCRNIL